MHRAAIAVAPCNAADVGAVGAQFAVRPGRRAAVVDERVTGFDRNVRVGVFANAGGGQGDDFVRAVELRVLRVDRLIEDPEFDALAAVPRGVGILRIDRAQAPVRLELRAAPAIGLTCPSGL